MDFENRQTFQNPLNRWLGPATVTYLLLVEAAQIRAAASVWDGVYTGEQARRGQAQYQQQCGACHGPTLAGAEMAPALASQDILDKWSGQTVGDFFQRIRITMPLGKPGRLSPDVNSDITAGAQVGDLFMSLIHTCQLCGANSFEYLTELQRHARELAAESGGVDALELSPDAGAAWSMMNPAWPKRIVCGQG